MSLQWHYLDSQGTEFGPFDAQKMRGWFEQGYFHVAGDNLLVRLAEWRTHRRLGELYAGDRTSYFVAPPRHHEGAPPPEAQGGSGPPQGNGWHGADHSGGSPYGAPPTALARYEPPPPAGGAAPYGGGAAPWQHPPPQHSWGRPPPAGPWGPPPPHGHHQPYGWGGPPPYGGGAYGGGGGWGPYGGPPPPAMGYGHPPPYGGYRHPPPGDDRGRSRSRSRSRPRQQQRNSAAENAARAAQEAEAELRRLGRDGLREILTTTLESLYKDRIKPMANYVKGRLKEKSCHEAVMKSFVEFYGQHSDLFRLQASPSDETAIFFVTEPSWFKGWVDIDAPEDPYDEGLWTEFKAFLDSGHSFAGGRYGMARELSQRNLPFLTPYSLGEICHIVQLAIQKRKIIVYHRKMLKPMPAASSVAAAAAPASDNGNAADAEEITEFPHLYRVIFKTLRRHPSGIRLSRLKQMIKEECQCRLNEMAFKCTKLIELFRQEPLRTVFALEDDGKEFVIRGGDPKLFNEEVRRIHAEVSAERLVN